jgi:hypothetical protein
MPTSTKAYLRLVSGTSAGRAYAGFGIRWSPGSSSTRRSGSSSSGALIPEGVKDRHTRRLEALDVASDYRKLMRPGRRRDQRVYDERGGIPSGQSRLLGLDDGRDRAGTGGGRSRVWAVHYAAWRRRHGAGRVRLRVAVLLRRVGWLGLGSGRDRRLRGYSRRRCGRRGRRWPRAVSWPGHGRWRVRRPRRVRCGGARPDCARGFSVRRWSG